jgi:hypothetical protein
MNASSTCDDCAAAALRPHHIFMATCAGCRARSVARSQPFYLARRAGRQEPDYIALRESLGLTHEQVKAAYAADAINQGALL